MILALLYILIHVYWLAGEGGALPTNLLNIKDKHADQKSALRKPLTKKAQFRLARCHALTHKERGTVATAWVCWHSTSGNAFCLQSSRSFH